MADPLTVPAATHILSAAARALHDSELAAHTVVAEQLLGIRSANYSDDDLEIATLAVAHQVSFQVARPSIFSLVESESKGSQSVSYHIPEYGSRESLMDETAVRLIASLATSDGYLTVRSFR